jgi:hypothetical protein
VLSVGDSWNNVAKRCGLSEIEAVAEDHFGDQVIGRMRHAHAHAEIDFPVRREIQVNGRKELVLLLAGGKKIRRRADSAVVFEAAGDFLCEVVAELEVRGKRDALTDGFTVEGTVESGIEGEIPAADLLVDDRADFPGPGVGGIPAPLVADFVGQAQADGPVPFFGDAHARTDVIADPIPALAVLRGSKNVESGFKPIREAMGDFDGFVELMIRGEQAILHGLRALEGEITMQLDHGVVRIDGVVAVDLDLVIVLRAGRRGESGVCRETNYK